MGEYHSRLLTLNPHNTSCSARFLTALRTILPEPNPHLRNPLLVIGYYDPTTTTVLQIVSATPAPCCCAYCSSRCRGAAACTTRDAIHLQLPASSSVTGAHAAAAAAASAACLGLGCGQHGSCPGIGKGRGGASGWRHDTSHSTAEQGRAQQSSKIQQSTS
jgi:hypothetical protein